MDARGQILERNCYSQSPVLTDFTPPPPPPEDKSGWKLVCNVKIVYGSESLKSENSQDYAQKPQRNCTVMNSASGLACCWKA
jgi:hypothetical protein